VTNLFVLPAGMILAVIVALGVVVLVVLLVAARQTHSGGERSQAAR
jgi:hypothetical protein